MKLKKGGEGSGGSKAKTELLGWENGSSAVPKNKHGGMHAFSKCLNFYRSIY